MNLLPDPDKQYPIFFIFIGSIAKAKALKELALEVKLQKSKSSKFYGDLYIYYNSSSINSELLVFVVDGVLLF